MDIKYILIIALVLCWTLNPFFKKYSASKLTSSEYLVFNHVICTFIVVFYFIYILLYEECDIKCLKKLNYHDIIFSILGAICSVLGSILLIQLLKTNDAVGIIPNIQPLVLILTLLIGKFIFKENLSFKKIIGIIIITLGIYLINN